MFQFFNPFDLFPFMGIFGLFAVIIPLIVFLFIISILCRICRAAGPAAAATFSVRPPDFVLPPQYEPQQPHTQTSGTDIRMVRLPTRCPSCGASLSAEDIDWVGPLEAKCNYCGATVRATLDRL